MTTVADILGRYRELCDYCADLTRRVEKHYGSAWQCRAGCGECCRLETVCGLEVVALLSGGEISPPVLAAREDDRCCLLREEQCQVYASRPLICRTHGLPLVSGELTGGEVDCCPLNIPALAAEGEIEIELVLNLDQLTENLLRLNLAFFLLLGCPELAEARFPLSVLAGGRPALPPALLAVVRELSGEKS